MALCAGRHHGYPVNDVDYPVDKEASWRLVYEHDLAHRIEQTRGAAIQTAQIKGCTDGHLLSLAPDGQLAIAIRNFWQSYPKGMQIDPDAVTIDVFSFLFFQGSEEV